MKCPSEFVLSQYADEELPESEAEDLRAHLAVCVVCRRQTEALRMENQLLFQSLRSIDLEEPAGEFSPDKGPERTGIGRIAAIFICLAVLLRLGYGLVERLESLSILDWLNPFSLSGQLNWFANLIYIVISEGSSMVTTLINGVGFALLSVLGLSSLAFMTRRMRRGVSTIGVLILMAVFVLPGYSLDIRKGEHGLTSNITIAAGETVNDTLVAAGDVITVNGTITGDLIAFARKIKVQGTVQGNVISFAQRIDISGTVEGDVFSFAQSIDLSGKVARNIWVFGQNVTVDHAAKIDQDATIFASDLSVDGIVGRDLVAYAGFLDAGGVVGRDLRFGGERLSLSPASNIGRDLEANVKSAKNVLIEPGATIGGKRKIKLIEPQPNKFLTFAFYMNQLLRIGTMFLTGLILLLLAPAVGSFPLTKLRTLLTSAGIGFLAAIALPVAAIILFITLIGIPIALVGIALWLLSLYLAKILVAACIGRIIVGKNVEGVLKTALSLFVGLVLVIVAVNLPYIGGILNFLLILIGFGALMISIFQMWKMHRRPAVAGEAV